MNPPCYTNTNTNKNNFINLWVPPLERGRHHTIKIKIIL